MKNMVSIFMLLSIPGVVLWSCTDDSVLDLPLEAEQMIGEGGSGVNGAQGMTTISINNPGFESSWSSWNDTDPSAISGSSNSGSKSAKITGSSGRFEQTVTVSANTNYELAAYLIGKGKIGATVGGSDFSTTADNGSWGKETVSFNSGSATSITIYGAYGGGTGRFDDYTLTETGGSSNPGNGSNSQLSVASVTASANDGNGPNNTLDGSLSTRWSANGNGQSITYDLGSSATVSSVKIAWYKGNQRSASFEIWVGASTNSLTKVFDGNGSGSTLSLEEYNTTDQSGRYVRIMGYGNSSNSWNSITETEIYGTTSGGGADTTPPGPVSGLTANAGDGQVSLSWSNPNDGDFSNVEITYSGGSVTTSGSSRTITGLNNGTNYTFTVRAYDNAGNASSSRSVSATPQANNSTTPSGVLGITAQTWKINSFDGSPGPNATYYDDITDLSGVTVANYDDPNYYYTDGTWTWFKCYRGLGTSQNSSNPRVELRELNGSGGLASWDGSIGTHTMEWDVRVDRLPRDADGKGGVLCFGQIHGPSPNNDGVDVDDIIRVQFIGDEDQTTGGVRLKISGYITEVVRGGSVTMDLGYQLDTEYTFKIVYTGGTVYLYENNVEIFKQAMDTGTEGNYFKVGNYLQSVKGASYTGSYGLVGVKNLTITHN